MAIFNSHVKLPEGKSHIMMMIITTTITMASQIHMRKIWCRSTSQKHETSDTCRSGIVWPSLREMKVASEIRDVPVIPSYPIQSRWSLRIRTYLPWRSRCTLWAPAPVWHLPARWGQWRCALAIVSSGFRDKWGVVPDLRERIHSATRARYFLSGQQGEFCQVAPKTSGGKKLIGPPCDSQAPGSWNDSALLVADLVAKPTSVGGVPQ